MGLFSKGKGAVRADDGAEAALERDDDERDAGVRDGVRNDLVQAALQSWASAKDARRFANVLRQCATGELLLDGGGSELADPAGGFRPGDTQGIGYRTDDQGRRLLLAFSSTERLAAYRGGERTPSFAQPATATLKQATDEPFDGIAIDAGSDALCIAYADEIRRHLTDDPALNEELKTALVTRTLPWDELLDLLGRTRTVFIAMQELRDDDGAASGFSVPTVDGKNGENYVVAFTSPAEVWAWAPAFDAQSTGVANIARAALEDGNDGVILNPAGQSVLISPDELARFAH
ncbi:SseB family protein [Leifsonia sp. NPDC058248]|uniref:SseB family protein n=1 Tax=Leifsonia sp. NPDC058248 TaxID=3346402 RepID=UPI0036DCE592